MSEKVTIKVERKKLHLPTIALRGLVVFPNNLVHFEVGREKSIAAVEWAMANNSNVFLVAQKSMDTTEPQQADLFSYGVVAEVKQKLRDAGVEAAGLTVFLVEEGEERGGLNATDLKDAGVLDGGRPGTGGDGVVIGLGAVVDELVECLGVERGGSLGIFGALGGAGGGTLVGLGAGVGAAGKTKAGDGCEGGGDKAAAVENDLLGEVLAHGRTPFSIKSLAVE